MPPQGSKPGTARLMVDSPRNGEFKARKGVAAGLLAAALAAGSASAALALEPIPHEAFYTLKVDKWKLPGGTKKVTGGQSVSLMQFCKDWERSARFQLHAVTDKGKQLNLLSNFQSEEARDGTRFEFALRVEINGEVLQRIRGVARRPSADAPGEIAFTRPGIKTVPLPAGALFPVQALDMTSDAWLHGKKKANYVLFDGQRTAPVEVFELLLGPARRPAERPIGEKDLVAGEGWRTVRSYYPLGKTDDTALGAATVSRYLTGVASRKKLGITIADVGLDVQFLSVVLPPGCNQAEATPLLQASPLNQPASPRK